MLNDAVAIVLFQTLQKSAGSPLSWATLPFLGANFAFIGFGSMAIGALRQALFFGFEHGFLQGVAALACQYYASVTFAVW